MGEVMKKIKWVHICLGVLAFGALACKPAPKDPPFDMGFVRQDAKVSFVMGPALKGPQSIGANELWKKTTGKMTDGSRVRVAIIGTGIDYTIPDLREALWINSGEVGDHKWDNSNDDDENGFADDIMGYDFYSGDPYPFDWHGHDTYIASIIAATGRTNPKVVGIAPNAELMILRYLGSDGGMSRDTIGFDGAMAFEYAIDNGAKVIYFNWPAGGFTKMQSALLLEQIKEAESRNIVVVIPAGNSANQDVPFFLREATKLKNTLVVAGLDQGGKLSKTSNSGRTLASIAAPIDASAYYPGGVVGNDLRTTSVAAAYVTGAAALLVSLPNFGSAAKIKDTLMLHPMKEKLSEPLDVIAEGSLDIGGF
jgi:subtilisin family serine protease